MTSPKETIMMTFAITGTVLGIASTVLHFIPLPNHKETPRNVVNIKDGKTNSTKDSFLQVEFSGDEWPTHIHIEGEPENVQYPIRYTTGTYNDINTRWATYTNNNGDTKMVCLLKQKQ